MSFYTSLNLYRPTRPPRVTGPLLAAFVEELCATGLFERTGAEYFHVKFGRSIDKDDRDTAEEVPVPGVPGMFTVRSIKWDVDHDRIALADALTILSNHNRPIYRAAVTLGTLRKDVYTALQTQRPPPEVGENMCLWDCNVRLGPVTLASLSDDATFAVGWMSVSFSGNGYLFPWTPRDLTSRAASLPQLQPVVEICRKHFPVHPEASPTVLAKLSPAARRRRVRELRRRMGELWPLDDLDAPWDWFWGVSETG
jgi:hypothetical protein